VTEEDKGQEEPFLLVPVLMSRGASTDNCSSTADSVTPASSVRPRGHRGLFSDLAITFTD
jgi:hypothetical protein